MIGSPDTRFPDSLEAISRHIGLLAVLKSTAGPLTVRQALSVSQREMGQMLGHYTRCKPPTRGTITTWERVERGERLPRKYQMTAETREAYRRLLADVVMLASAGDLHLGARMGPRRWRFWLTRACAECSKPFRLRRITDKRCRRCVRCGQR